MLSRRHSVLFAVIALCGGLLLWSWDDLLSDVISTHGILRRFLVSIEFLLFGPGSAVMAYAVSENIRASRIALATERERARTQRLVALGRVAAGLAHEVRNPLHNIRLLVEESRETPDEAGRTGLLDRVDANLARIDRAVELVYRLARPQQLAAAGETCDLVRLTTDAVECERRRTADKSELRLEAPASADAVANADDVRIALDNLLRNASAASGGEAVLIHVARHSGGWQVSIRNRGRLPAAVIGSQGEGFESTKPGGLGLGLAISRQLMQEAGGSLDLVQAGDMVEARLVLPAESRS
jgi:signal transduction histidine kinase